MSGQLGAHEILGMHERILSEVTAAYQLGQSIGQIQDAELKNIAETCLDTRKRHLNDMRNLLRQHGIS